MHISRPLRSLACAALAASPLAASAVSIIDSLSFGHKDAISQDRSTIPGWTVSGEGHNPQVLSDRVILTPPYPGNKRGQVWAQAPVDRADFVADVEFRASGQDRSNGNLQVWLTSGGAPPGGVSSVYTVSQFDGLVLSIDQYGGHGGKIRGFLNDGTISFKDHHSVDSLAFGQCDYPYRNRGIPSKLKITQTGNSFAVNIDDKTCFSTDKVNIPAGYKFGVSAASAENPDSFEIFKFTVSMTDGGNQAPPNPPAVQQQEPIRGYSQDQHQQVAGSGGSQSSISKDQFDDVNARVQIINKRVDEIYNLLQDMKTRHEQTHTELMSLNKNGPIHDHVGAVETKVGRIEGIVTAIQKDLEGKGYHLANLQSALRDTHSGLQDSLSDVVTRHAPKMWTFVFLVIIVQVLMFGGYLVYKRRRDSAPKKYL
ncbi:putative lectin family integral membrane protein [Botryosphaeria dothidea]|uniref:Lectin family integral membrane protein n=1 Tax=Botryosphaeria dothidea TaxID=55169 RepID=A0A8H4II27_9PEZI|nr:putative lectin family integral membrane protein [Botryosphaeria dothidea]